jgi:hypothetical protein
MKLLSAGVTFVNFATISGLLLGIIDSGLSHRRALVALGIGVAVAILGYLGTLDTNPGSVATESTSPKLSKRAKRRLQGSAVATSTPLAAGRYRTVWKWLLAAIFAIFAFRSFCWLLYIDGNELKIQSPNNLGDLALHITHIKYFATGVPLWPANPIYVFSHHLRYPAGIDLFNALLYLVHVDLTRGLIWTGLLASLATFYAFYRWAGEFGVAGFLFNGGVAGFQIIKTLRFLDYQDVDHIAWKSIPLTMFLTQRGLLYAIPAGLLLLWHWREKIFKTTEQPHSPLPFWVELSLYASMPLFHVHTFIALSIVLVCLFITGDRRTRTDIFSLVVSAVVPAAFFIWLTTDHFQAKSVIEFHWGWAQRDAAFELPFLQFWFLNFGVLLPLVLILFGLCAWRFWRTTRTRQFELVAALALGIIIVSSWRIRDIGLSLTPSIFLLAASSFLAWAVYRIGEAGYAWNEKLPAEIAFLFAGIAIFVFFFLVKTAPWIWDNVKIGIWAYFIVLPLLWTQFIVRWEAPIRAAICFGLFFSGFVSLFGGLAAPGFGFANRAELDGVGVAVRHLPAEARFAAYPIYNHPLLLQGRKVVLGYPGHLWTQGFDDYAKTQDQLRQLMEGTGDWRETARRLQVRYIFWGREEKINYPMSSRPWEKTIAPVASGSWGAIYDLGNVEE